MPEIARTRVDLPWATWPIVPMFIVAYLEMISGLRGVINEGSKLSRVCLWRCFWASQAACCLSITSSLDSVLRTYSVDALVVVSIVVSIIINTNLKMFKFLIV